jgi:chemotaxis protein CheD
MPGEFWFGGGGLRVGTLLGSCVSITFWHPAARIGGMCHYLLPSRNRTLIGDDESDRLDGRYAEEAVAMFLHEIRRTPTRPEDYEVKIFGGGNQFHADEAAGRADVAARNIDAGLRLIERHGLAVRAHHLGGHGPRQILMDLATGDVWVRHLSPFSGRSGR